MKIKDGLYTLQKDTDAHRGLSRIPVHHPPSYSCDCPGGVFRAVQLVTGDVVCPGCDNGPCRLPEGIAVGREIRIINKW